MSGPRYEDWQLRHMAGATTYARGAAYAKEDRVRLLSIGPTVVRAQVSGSELYSVVLEGDEDDIWGDCDCPAYEDRGFCKHLVAVALVVNAASPETMGKVEQARDAIRAHLAGLSQDVLIERLMTLAARESKLWAKLELETAIASADDATVYQRIAAAADAAMDLDEAVDWRGAGAVADELREVVRQIDELAEAGRGELALRLLNRLFDGAPEVQEAVDDSAGEISSAFYDARDLHLRLCLANVPDPKVLAAELFEREMADDYGLWEDTHRLYADLLGPAGLAEFRRLAETALRGNPSNRLRLRGILDAFAEADGDVDTRIRLRAADASSASDYHQIVQICLDAGRKGDALKWAEEGVWKTEDRPERSLAQLTARLLREHGQTDKAQKLLWRLFERAPDMGLHQDLLGGGESKDSVVDRCVRVLEANLAKKGGSAWWGVSDLLVEILLKADRTDHAWVVAQAHVCQNRTLVALAEATLATHRDLALDSYVRLIERCVTTTTQGGYEQAIGYLNRLGQLRSMCGRSAEHAPHIEALAVRHKAKRNFIKLLRGMPTAS